MLPRRSRRNASNTLTSLELRGDGCVGGAAVGVLAAQLLPRCAALRRLVLDCDAIVVPSAAYEQLIRALAAHPQLTHLALTGPPLWDTAGLPVAPNGALIGEDPRFACPELVRLLRDSRSLERLSLRWFRIGDEGARGLASALRDNWKRSGPRLRELDLRSNCIGDAGIRAFLDALLHLSALREAAAAAAPSGAADAAAESEEDHAPLFTVHFADNFDLSWETRVAVGEFHERELQWPLRQRLDVDFRCA